MESISYFYYINDSYGESDMVLVYYLVALEVHSHAPKHLVTLVHHVLSPPTSQYIDEPEIKIYGSHYILRGI